MWSTAAGSSSSRRAGRAGRGCAGSRRRLTRAPCPVRRRQDQPNEEEQQQRRTKQQGIHNVPAARGGPQDRRPRPRRQRVFQRSEPWRQVKTDESAAAATVYTALKLRASLSVLLEPGPAPILAARLRTMLRLRLLRPSAAPHAGADAAATAAELLAEHDGTPGAWCANWDDAAHPLGPSPRPPPRHPRRCAIRQNPRRRDPVRTRPPPRLHTRVARHPHRFRIRRRHRTCHAPRRMRRSVRRSRSTTSRASTCAWRS